MDSSLDGSAGVTLKRNEMSLAEKRQLVVELAKDSDSAYEVLLKWKRHDLLEILSVEVGEERKYRSKAKIINILLKTISERTPEKDKKIAEEKDDSSTPTQQIYKRRRKNSHPTRFVAKVASCSSSKELKVDGIKACIQEEEKEATIVDRELVLKEAVQEKLPERQDRPEKGEKSGNGGFDLSYYVNIIRQLERSGYIKSDFRQVFLTWYTMRATPYEKEIVNAYIHVFKDDGKDLAQQLLHSFPLSL